MISNILYEPLPIQIQPTSTLETDNKTIKHILYHELPRADIPNLENELKWAFLLSKHSLSNQITKKSKRKPKKTFLTRNQRKELNLLKLPKGGWKYEDLEGMRTMWKEYMRQNLQLAKAPKCTDLDWSSFSTIVAKSELVGAELSVVRSKVPNQIGIRGTVVLETKMTFQIVNVKSQLKTIVKDSSVFEFHLDTMKFVVFGKHIATRPSERSVKKIKGLMFADL